MTRIVRQFSMKSFNRFALRDFTIPIVALLSIFMFLQSEASWAATISAASCSYSDVNSALDRASNGDTVLVPPGTCTWSTSMDFDTNVTGGTNKYLTLQGAGIDQTIIIDGVSKAPFPNIAYLIRWTTVNGGLTRISGFTFQGGSSQDSYNQGMIYIRGNSQQFRFDHNKVIVGGTSGMMMYGNVVGVLDHDYFNVSKGWGLYTFHESWGGKGSYGDNSWASPSTLGTQQALFVEDSTFFNDQSNGFHRYAVDGWEGGRVVFRNNSFIACTWGNHGTESGGRQRGQRQYEVYNNTWTWDLKGNSFPSLVGTRGGVGVVFNNTANITNGYVTQLFDMTYYRATQSFAPWGQCPSAYDQSSTSCLDQTGKGQGNLISGDSPSPAAWSNEITDPTYAWNNKVNGAVSNAVSHVPTVVALNRDFFNSARPGYTPFTYPHPLTSGSTSSNPPPAPPQNLTVQ